MASAPRQAVSTMRSCACVAVRPSSSASSVDLAPPLPPAALFCASRYSSTCDDGRRYAKQAKQARGGAGRHRSATAKERRGGGDTRQGVRDGPRRDQNKTREGISHAAGPGERRGQRAFLRGGASLWPRPRPGRRAAWPRRGGSAPCGTAQWRRPSAGQGPRARARARARARVGRGAGPVDNKKAGPRTLPLERRWAA